MVTILFWSKTDLLPKGYFLRGSEFRVLPDTKLNKPIKSNQTPVCKVLDSIVTVYFGQRPICTRTKAQPMHSWDSIVTIYFGQRPICTRTKAQPMHSWVKHSSDSEVTVYFGQRPICTRTKAQPMHSWGKEAKQFVVYLLNKDVEGIRFSYWDGTITVNSQLKTYKKASSDRVITKLNNLGYLNDAGVQAKFQAYAIDKGHSVTIDTAAKLKAYMEDKLDWYDDIFNNTF